MLIHHHTTGEPFKLIYNSETGQHNTTKGMIVNGTPFPITYKLSDGSKVQLQPRTYTTTTHTVIKTIYPKI